VIRKKGMDFMTINYRYDGSGNRVMKLIEKRMKHEITFTTTHYIRDATGNIMATYTNRQVQELHIYGSTRLGAYNIPYEPHPTDPNKQIQKDDFHKLILGRRNYELSNHLGNVLAVISDKKVLNGSTFEADVVATNDYYPFGMTIASRTFQSEEYRFGFNGKENDKDFGTGYVDFGARVYDSETGRWFATDPLCSKYPMDSPYMFAGNSPITTIDLDGEEKIIIAGSENRKWNLGFVIPALKFLKEKVSDKEQTTLILFTANYTEKQRNRIKKYVQKKGGVVLEVNSADEVVDYMNNKTTSDTRQEDPITELNIFSHGLPNQLAFGYGQDENIANQYSFNESHVDKLNPEAFTEHAYCVSYACRTGAANYNDGDVEPENSLAQKLANKIGITVWALQRRSDYIGILGPKKPWQVRLQERIRLMVGYQKPDTTYDANGGTWDTDSELDKTYTPRAGTTPENSPGWTKFEKGKKPYVLKKDK